MTADIFTICFATIYNIQVAGRRHCFAEGLLLSSPVTDCWLVPSRRGVPFPKYLIRKMAGWFLFINSLKIQIEDRHWRRRHFSQPEHDNDQFLFPQFSQKLGGASQTLAEEKLSTFLKTSKPKVNFIYMSFDCVLNHLLLSKHPP